MAKGKEPQLGSFFRVTFAGKESIGVFRDVSGLSSETEVTEEAAVDDRGRPVIRKVLGANKFENITLKRGITSDLDLWKWRQQVIDNGPEEARADGTIELLDAQGRTLTTYKFRQGWPIKYSGPDLSAGSTEVAIETIEIAHEGFERT
jgi:phage tail-like protein